MIPRVFQDCVAGRATSIYSIPTTQNMSKNIALLNIQEKHLAKFGVCVCFFFILFLFKRSKNVGPKSHRLSLWIPELVFFFKPSKM